MNQALYFNLLKTGIAIIFLVAMGFAIDIFIKHKVKSRRKSLKARVASRYILVFCFLFFMAKIWVEGFGYLLTVIGFISAALTITQKEYLMNIVGWLIIMWRNLFVEGDYIEIGKYHGYVQQIGPLYFLLEEASDLIWGDKTGRLIKIPNGLIAGNPIVNFTLDKAFIEGKLDLVFSLNSSLEKIKQLQTSLTSYFDKIMKKLSKEWTERQTQEFVRLKELNQHQPRFLLRVEQDDIIGLMLKIRYFSLKKDQQLIENEMFELIMKYVQENTDVALSTDI